MEITTVQHLIDRLHTYGTEHVLFSIELTLENGLLTTYQVTTEDSNYVDNYVDYHLERIANGYEVEVPSLESVLTDSLGTDISSHSILKPTQSLRIHINTLDINLERFIECLPELSSTLIMLLNMENTTESISEYLEAWLFGDNKF